MEKLQELKNSYEKLQKEEKIIMEKMNKATKNRDWDLEFKYECKYFAIGEMLNMKYMEIQDLKRDLGMETLHNFYMVQ